MILGPQSTHIKITLRPWTPALLQTSQLSPGATAHQPAAALERLAAASRPDKLGLLWVWAVYLCLPGIPQAGVSLSCWADDMSEYVLVANIHRGSDALLFGFWVEGLPCLGFGAWNLHRKARQKRSR